MENSKRNRMILAILFVASIAVIIGTVSYAYFTSDLGENTNQELVLTAGTMQMKFSDNDAGVNANLNFGQSVTKEFILENTGTLATKAKITFTNMINTYLEESLTYKLEYKTSEESTTYIVAQDTKNVPRSEVASTQTLANNLELPVGAKYYYRLTITLENLSDVDQTDDINAIFSTTFDIEEGSEEVTNITADTILKKFNITAKEGNPTFTNTATTDEGVYAMADDYGTSYYYRGAVTNNYIKYGKYGKDVYFGDYSSTNTRYKTYSSLEECNKGYEGVFKTNCRIGITVGEDMWWRIIRINGDGSLRIIYDGTQGYANGTANNARYAITSQPWNAKFNDAKYVGWMFGGAQGSASTSKEQAQRNETSSEVKTAVDTWYKENILDTGYGDNVVDRVFCNDRSTPGSAATGWSNDTGLGYGTNGTAYGAYARFYQGGSSSTNYNNPQPKFTCEVKNDAFTVEESETTNGALTYPVGLITSDEIVTAGSGKYRTTNKSYYLYKSTSYFGWSLSPYHEYGSNAIVFNVRTNGNLDNAAVHDTSGAVAPVVNLSQEYASTLIGDGSITNPFRDPSATV